MDSFIFALSAVLPIIAMVAIGYLLKKIGFMDAELAKRLNKLVFRIFLPVMLFLNVYRIEDMSSIDGGFILYALCALVVIFLIALPTSMLLTRDPKRRGALLQGSFRSNYALIGVPLAESLFGTAGSIAASVLLAIAVPTFNVLAVISLSLFSEGKGAPSVKKILLGIVKNPLIQGVAAGGVALAIRLIMAECGAGFNILDIEPLAKVLSYLSSLATPIALLVLGAQFEFSAVKELRREIISGTLIRALIVPLLAIGCAYLFFRDRFGGAQFASLVAMFGTPVAVSSVPMAQEMNSDATLAGQLVVWTTIASAFTVFIISFVLSLLGIFPKM